VLVLGTVLSVYLLSTDEIRRIGEIPAGLPQFQFPVFSKEQWLLITLDAMVLGMLGAIDALLTSVIADSLTRKQHNSDKELVGQGIGNVMSGLFGGLPGAGATMGTVVNIQTGARSALSGLVRAGILIVIVMWASDLTAFIPLAVLAGIAFKVGFDIIDWKFLKRAHRLSHKAAAITYGVILLTVFVDLIAAVGIGLFVANVMTITRLSELQADDVEAIQRSEDVVGDSLGDYEKELIDSANGKVMLMLLKGAMMFGVSRAISRKNSEMNDCDAFIVDISNIVHLGVSSALALEECLKDMLKKDKRVYVVHSEGQPFKRLRALGILNVIPEKNIMHNRRKAMEMAIYGKDSESKGSGVLAALNNAVVDI
jgi:SulP family sulfate permease